MQDAKPSFSYSPDDSGFVKDFRWTRKDKHSYLVLSSNGKLFHGTDSAPPKHVMDGVDAGLFRFFSFSFGNTINNVIGSYGVYTSFQLNGVQKEAILLWLKIIACVFCRQSLTRSVA